jgi:aminopeptidase-like protein
MVSALPQRQFTWRFVFLPETIGSIAWLWLNRDVVKQRTAAGLVLSCVGDSGPFTYKQSRRGDTLVDRVANQVLRDQGAVIPFTPVTGSDERQYCSPGFDLPIGLLSRTYPGRFPEYHTSLDTPTVVTTENLSLTISALRAFAAGLEANARRLQRVDPHCEPMLSRRGLYHTLSIRKSSAFDRAVDPRTALMWVLSYCDGKHDLIDIAEKSGLPLEALTDAAERALHANLLTTVQSGCGSQ